MDQFKAWLNGPEDGRKLGLFRIIFGACMVVRMLDYYKIDFIQKGILAPKLHFTFEGFSWVKPLPGPAMQAILAAMLVSAVLLALGKWMRAACGVLAVGSWYFLFLEKAYFNNHLYLFILLYILIAFTDADRFFSMGKNAAAREVPRWQVLILQLQVMVVYFYGGVAKLNGDWLFRQEPVRSMLNGGMFAGNELAVQFFSIGGLAIDLFAPFLLWWKPARRWAIWGFLFFHVMNAVNFNDIGVFPFVMIGALLLYLEAAETGWVYRLFGKWGIAPADVPQKGKKGGAAELLPEKPLAAAYAVFEKPAAWVTGFLAAHFLFQLLFPLRGYFLPNPQDFTTIGNRFSWHMKIDNRSKVEMVMKIKDAKKGREAPLPLGELLNTVQVAHLATDPRSVAQVAAFSKAFAAKIGYGDVGIFSNIRFSYNGRPVQDFIRPEVDLSGEAVDPLKKIGWLVLPGE